LLFNTFQFWLFFSATLALYLTLRREWQNRLLLVASYVFYGFWDPRFLALIAFSTVVDYFLARKMSAEESAGKRKLYLWVSVGVNLGVLGIFKYLNFFLASTTQALTSLGFEASQPTLSIILPVGISFYTFQTLSYTIDVYRRRLEPVEGFFDFALFVSFFPQLVAGPIERARDFLPQLQQPREVTAQDWGEGLTLILIGLFKKVAVADQLAPLVDQAFGGSAELTSLSLLLGVYFFAFQIYADFSGYTDIARGVARMFGFRLTLNFSQPYFATSITEFWRRWHISLSSWLRDYLYISLGGNRRGKGRTYLNLFATMLLGGLWHGAGFTFVIWGGLHGLYLTVHKLILKDRPGAPDEVGRVRSAVAAVIKSVALFQFVCLAWIFFRAQSLSDALSYLSRLLGVQLERDGFRSLSAGEVRPAIWSVLTLLLLVDLPQRLSGRETAPNHGPRAWRIASLAVLVLWLIHAEPGGRDFIYFQF